MKINSHPEKKLEGILRQDSLFKSAKKMIKELKRDIKGLPSMEYDQSSSNLYNFVLNRKTDNTLQYSTRAHPLKKNQRTNSFILIKRQDVKKKQLRFGSREGRREQNRIRQQMRRRSCYCSECGIDNTKIIQLMYKGATCNRQIDKTQQMNKQKIFYEEAKIFSNKIARKIILLKNRSNLRIVQFRKRCNSLDTHISTQGQQVLFQIPKRKEQHFKSQARHTVIMKRQQTINDKLLLIPIKNLKVVQEIHQTIKTQPTQPSNTSSKILKKKPLNRTYIPVTRQILPQISPSKFSISNNKSIDDQLKIQVRQKVKELQKQNIEQKKNSISSLSNPYRNISQLDYLLKVRRRQYV